jgi:hypothetical protein
VSVCSLHRFHRPTPLTTERHHIIPQAWQIFALNDGNITASKARQMAAVAREGGITEVALFDPRTVTLAPTCHRNVHYWIVKLMQTGQGEAPLDGVPMAFGRGGRLSGEQKLAIQALTRWRASGYMLGTLRRAKLWGQA